MRVSSTWFYYGAGLICIGVSIWLVASPPDEERAASRSGASHGLGDEHANSSDSVDRPQPLPTDPPTVSHDAASILPVPKLPPLQLGEQERAAWIRQYCGQLAEYSYMDDLATLEQLLAELSSSELEIAESAHHNLMARHDRRAVVYLEQQIAVSKSAFEKKRLQELVDFLNTPGISESDLIKKPAGR